MQIAFLKPSKAEQYHKEVQIKAEVATRLTVLQEPPQDTNAELNVCTPDR